MVLFWIYYKFFVYTGWQFEIYRFIILDTNGFRDPIYNTPYGYKLIFQQNEEISSREDH